MRKRLPLLPALLLAACQSAPHPKPVPPAPAPVTAVTAIHGQALYLERIAPPPGATLEVQLFDERGTTLAAQSFEGLRGPPYAFDLPYDGARVDASHRYAVRAVLRDARGRLRFATDARVPVVPGRADRVELRLVPSTLPNPLR
ncbi:YbaY family lipoprotein [Dokdonella sp.]|uniref:YbaY family lipoprotein n=1 Tax=Dokdonella sp. TaxID=2291710 RepID=UPI0026186E1D|nr:YbaY family lipoprotein [Dokdonella sp.]